ncbi:MAG TPA: ABC transporter permease [Streptosporangiaceae bacterium]|nr:ABC transporter permease [Streptosporangiaceae bacterium]
MPEPAPEARRETQAALPLATLPGASQPAPPVGPPPGGATSLADAEGPGIQARSQLRMATERFIRHRVALIGLFLFVGLVLWSTVGPLFWKYSFTQVTNDNAVGPSAQHPFGTDLIGHDLFAQVMTAEATSVKTALVVAVIATALGTLVGATAGYYGKWVDMALMRVTDLFLAVPLLAVLLVVANKLSKQAGSWFWIAIILAAVLWTPLARLVRGAFLSLREREFVEAERAIGASDARIIGRHMIPNAMGPITVNATLTVALALLIEAALSFLGLGIQPPEVSLGLLVNTGQDAASTLPWLFYFPAGFLVLTVLSVNFIGDGLRDALDPTQRGSR